MSDSMILLDEHRQVVGSADKLLTHQMGWLHLAFSLQVMADVDGQRLFLLQQRAQQKYHCGGLWTNSCCSHPRVGESFDVACYRRIFEEFGIELQVPLISCSDFTYRAEVGDLIEHEWDHIFLAHCDASIKIAPHPEEIEDWDWWTAEEIDHALIKKPEQFTPWFSQVWQHVQQTASTIELTA